MAESNKGETERQPDIDRPGKEAPPMGWRRSSVGLGMFVMVCALLAMASGNQVARFLGKLLVIVAFLLMAVPVVAIIVNSVSSKIRRPTRTINKPGS
jgi:hypothetical protein